MAIVSHESPFRSDKVLHHARGQTCTLRLPGICDHNPETTVSAHIRDEWKGMGTKASDHSIVFACGHCHAYLDVGHFTHPLISDIELYRAIIRGLQTTWGILIRDEVIGFPHNPPPKPRAPKVRKPPADRQQIKTRKGPSWPSRKISPRQFQT